MNVKSKAYDYLQRIKNSVIHDIEARMILHALIKNGAVHADDVWPAEKLIEAYEEVMGEDEGE